MLVHHLSYTKLTSSLPLTKYAVMPLVAALQKCPPGVKLYGRDGSRRGPSGGTDICKH